MGSDGSPEETRTARTLGFFSTAAMTSSCADGDS
jgi:hypothetical protein